MTIFVIGEKINATREDVTRVIEERNESALVDLAVSQVEAGADYVDVNVADRKSDSDFERESMTWAVGVIERAVDVPLVIDSADPKVIQAGLSAIKKKPPIVNSVSGGSDTLDTVLKFAKDAGGQVVALAMDDNGIPNNAEDRVKICRSIVLVAKKVGFSFEKLIFDPLVLPIGVQPQAARVTLRTLQQIKELAASASTVMGISNVSYGLPRRGFVNQAFLSLATLAGLDYAILDPLDRQLMHSLRATEAVLGRDKHCRKYITAIRKEKKGETSSES
jgi:5-methyltetrahydrofolate--homocysteine methyltransferase